MGLFNAFVKTGLTAINNHCYKSAQRKAHKTAYALTGKRLSGARKTGCRINGSAEYYRQKNIALRKAEERKNLRQTFIDNI